MKKTPNFVALSKINPVNLTLGLFVIRVLMMFWDPVRIFLKRRKAAQKEKTLNFGCSLKN